MINKIFKNTMICVTVACLALCLFVYGLFQSTLIDQVKYQLKENAQLIASSYQSYGKTLLTNIPSNQRISIIDNDGTVIYDSIKDVAGLENHLMREEVQQALQNGEGFAKRYSNSVHQNYLYYAFVMNDGTIIRLAEQVSSISSVLSSIAIQLILVIILILFVTYWLSRRLCKNIIARINAIDIDNPYVTPSFSELNPLLTRLDQQNCTINQQVEQLKQYDHEFNAIIANMDEGLVVINNDLKVLSFNEAALRLFALDTIEEGNSVYEFNGSLPFVQLIQNAQKGISGSNVLSINNRYIRVVVSPVKTNESVTGALVLALDVSDSRNQQLLRAQFSATVSHELKTPLTSIIGFSEILANGLVDNKDVVSVGKDIYDQSKRLLNMVEDVIHLSKLDEADQQTFKLEEISLKSVIEEMINQYNIPAEQKHISLNYDNSNSLIVGNRSIVKECIGNLIENAIKYGKVNGHVWVSVSEDTGYVNVSVKDDGVGIAEKETSRIFERFYRVDQSRNQTIKGTGLGLSIVKHGMELHNGNVLVKSKVGLGTEFILAFPK